MSKKILVVDDDELVRQSLGRMLADKGFTVEQAKNGREGLQKVIDGAPDLVIADVRMPEMDGIQMVGELRRDPKGKDVPVIILSNDEQATSLNQALKAGVTVYLSKSNLDVDALTEQISTALSPDDQK